MVPFALLVVSQVKVDDTANESKLTRLNTWSIRKKTQSLGIDCDFRMSPDTVLANSDASHELSLRRREASDQVDLQLHSYGS